MTMALRVAMITQAVDEDDPVLGFTTGWVKSLAQHVEHLDVVCLREGTHEPQQNVRVLVMPKGRLRRYFFLRNYLKTALRNKTLDAVFAHMCPLYAVAAGWVLKGRVPVGLWYAHSSVTMKLRYAIRASQVVFSCASSAMPVKTGKLFVTGHGVDTEKFLPAPTDRHGDDFVVASVGRISPVKQYHLVLPALQILRRDVEKIRYEIIGPLSGSSDEIYRKELENLRDHLGLSDVVVFRGPVPFSRAEQAYQSCDVLVNLTPGSFDKAVLEACASGVPVVTSNAAFEKLFGGYAKALITPSNDPHAIASRLLQIARMTREDRRRMGEYLREGIVASHSLERLMSEITSRFESLAR